ncbi:30S ribosomal protein S10 [Enterobacterales bacterium endosymbiont of Anomoneura mori]|uniref:30S ribosomal protein S10 n=1 Tax=Enterobacterales bacterium endosymbiont of Anomoneura mori TaxID=3132096 RepID=UPI00399CFF9D
MKKHIRIKLSSYDYRLINKIIVNFINIAIKTNSIIYGPIPLPIIRERFTILTSPHVDKKARDQYEICTYRRILEIITSDFKTINDLIKIKIFSGIDVKIITIN